MEYALTVLAMAKITDILGGEFDMGKLNDGNTEERTVRRAEIMAALSAGAVSKSLMHSSSSKKRTETGEDARGRSVDHYLSLDADTFSDEFSAAMKAVGEGLKRRVKAKKQ